MHRSINFFFLSADTKTQQQRALEEFVKCGSEMAEGTKSEQMGAGWCVAPPEEWGWTGSPATLHGCGLPTKDAGKEFGHNCCIQLKLHT